MENPEIPTRSRGKIMAGLLLVTVGTFLLLDRLGYWFPNWLFSWPMIPIILGLFIGFKHNFRHPAWFFLVVIGGLFLAEYMFIGLHVKKLIWPVLIMLVGFWMIFGRNRHPRWNKENWKEHAHKRWGRPDQPDQPDSPITGETVKPENVSSINLEKKKPDFFGQATENGFDDYIDTVSIFGGTKRIVLSKNFRGGDVVTVMGGAEINLSQADIQGQAELEVTSVMGGTRIIVPSNWEVKTAEMVALLGGVEDKRIIQPGQINPGKVLIIRGTSIFGGIDIRSF